METCLPAYACQVLVPQDPFAQGGGVDAQYILIAQLMIVEVQSQVCVHGLLQLLE